MKHRYTLQYIDENGGVRHIQETEEAKYGSSLHGRIQSLEDEIAMLKARETDRGRAMRDMERAFESKLKELEVKIAALELGTGIDVRGPTEEAGNV